MPPTFLLALRFSNPPTACYLVSMLDRNFIQFVTGSHHSSVNVNCFILENNLELVMFRVWNYYGMQMSTNIFICTLMSGSCHFDRASNDEFNVECLF